MHLFVCVPVRRRNLPEMLMSRRLSLNLRRSEYYGLLIISYGFIENWEINPFVSMVEREVLQGALWQHHINSTLLCCQSATVGCGGLKLVRYKHNSNLTSLVFHRFLLRNRPQFTIKQTRHSQLKSLCSSFSGLNWFCLPSYCSFLWIMYEICLGPQKMIPRGIDGPPPLFTLLGQQRRGMHHCYIICSRIF